MENQPVPSRTRERAGLTTTGQPSEPSYACASAAARSTTLAGVGMPSSCASASTLRLVGRAIDHIDRGERETARGGQRLLFTVTSSVVIFVMGSSTSMSRRRTMAASAGMKAAASLSGSG